MILIYKSAIIKFKHKDDGKAIHSIESTRKWKCLVQNIANCSHICFKFAQQQNINNLVHRDVWISHRGVNYKSHNCFEKIRI